MNYSKLLIVVFTVSFLATACVPLSPRHREANTRPRPVRQQILTGKRPAPVEIHVDELRVLLRKGKKLFVSSSGPINLVGRKNGKTLVTLGKTEQGKISAVAGEIFYRDSGLGETAVYLRATDPGKPVMVAGHVYRGDLVVQADENKLLLLNEVSLNEYLYGVLPSEVPPQWPWSALRAQAVAARTYALFRANGTQSKFYDLDDSTSSQVYQGKQIEHTRTNQAVDDTLGIILTWKGQPAQAFFHSNCGGHTAASRDVWGSDLPYLRGVRDSYCSSEKHAKWEAELPRADVEKRLSSASKLKGGLKGIDAKNEDPSGRWRTVEINGTSGRTIVKSSDFRLGLGADLLRSTKFSIAENRKTFRFKGKGWGHGIGLCQEGAKGMADKGMDFKRILEYFYPGTRLESFEDL